MGKVKIANKTVDLKRGIDHIGVSAVAIVHNGRGKILLQKRGKQARDELGRWDVVGGAVEFGETVTETIEREIAEELCTTPQDIKFLMYFDAHRTQNGVNTHWVAIAHTVIVDPKTVKIGEPHKMEAIGWFGAKTLPSPLHSQFPKVHQILLDKKILR